MEPTLETVSHSVSWSLRALNTASATLAIHAEYILKQISPLQLELLGRAKRSPSLLGGVKTGSFDTSHLVSIYGTYIDYGPGNQYLTKEFGPRTLFPGPISGLVPGLPRLAVSQGKPSEWSALSMSAAFSVLPISCRDSAGRDNCQDRAHGLTAYTIKD